MEIIITESKQGTYTNSITAGSHVLTADEPTAKGGDDLGPSPYDYLLTALGACTSITVRMYANLKKIPLDNIVVKLSHEKIHLDDCMNCENQNALLDHITRKIEFQGNLTAEQRQKLLEIANKCPVHRTLTSKIFIETQLIG